MISPIRPRSGGGMLALTAVLGAASLALAACAGGNDQESAVGPQEGTPALQIQDFAFQPNALSAAAGGRVQISNKDTAPHTVTADDRSFDSGNIAPNGGAEITVSGTGEIPYHCSIHDYMRGVIRVGR